MAHITTRSHSVSLEISHMVACNCKRSWKITVQLWYQKERIRHFGVQYLPQNAWTTSRKIREGKKKTGTELPPGYMGSGLRMYFSL